MTKTDPNCEVAKSIPLYIRQRALLTILPFSSATLWRKVRDGSFVRPVRLSQGITAWKQAEVEAWLNEKEVKQ